MSQDVLFDEQGTLGIISLNAPKTLNSLTKDVCLEMASRLERWAHDDKIQCILLESTSERALCAGGDVVSLYKSIKAQAQDHIDFFKCEYALDLMIHEYQKPIVVLAHGIVMGGGIGITVGASHRVVTETTLMAMPEITIGFFPDVGGSYFLNRMPNRLGRFLGLTGARMNASDALYANMADHFVPSSALKELKDALISGVDPGRALDRLSKNSLGAPPPARIEPMMPTIDKLMDGQNILQIKEGIERFETDDKWLQQSLATFLSGSPTSMAVIFEQIERGKGMALADVFAMEKKMALNFGKNCDMPEGIRALLIDKDKNPLWNPKNLEDVSPELIESHFSS
ncbi:MAG: enoyl-CoA hydratase/isomerase family protein [Bacteriovoracales bacterium]|nr:enoyl-CoA hydratase/isomerase family protein [Bacteriovoracales bacterium]